MVTKSYSCFFAVPIAIIILSFDTSSAIESFTNHKNYKSKMNSTPTKQFDANNKMGACERSVHLGYLKAITSSINNGKIDLSIDLPSLKIFIPG